MNKISIVILNYNSFEDTKKCIEYLLNQDYDDFDIVVVDNASNVIDINKLKALCKQLSLPIICNPENKGFSAGNNVGIRYAIEHGSEAVLLINPDMEIKATDYLTIMSRKLFSDEEIVAVGSDIIDYEGFHQNPLREPRYIEELLWPIEILRKKLFSWRGYINYSNKSEWAEKLSGCCFLVKVSFLEEIGLLDEGVFLYCEEPIFAKLAKQRKRKMYYINEIKAYHIHIKSLKGSPKRRLQKMIDSRKYYLEKYSGYQGIALKLLLLVKELQRRIYNSIYK